jgi:hypothetical protein
MGEMMIHSTKKLIDGKVYRVRLRRMGVKAKTYLVRYNDERGGMFESVFNESNVISPSRVVVIKAKSKSKTVRKRRVVK